MKLRGNIITTVITGAVPSRKEMAKFGLAFQLVKKGRVHWAKKPFWGRNIPYTAAFPTKPQLLIRGLLAGIAQRAYGKTGLDKATGLPLAAAEVQRRLKGVKTRDTGRYPYKDWYRLKKHIEHKEEWAKLGIDLDELGTIEKVEDMLRYLKEKLGEA